MMGMAEGVGDGLWVGCAGVARNAGAIRFIFEHFSAAKK